VQIEYDVELYGAEKLIELPFVMGVMADLSGNPAEDPAPIAQRDFQEIDVDNFDDRLKAAKPRAAFHVENKLSGEGNLAVEMTVESMDDFSPAAVAQKVEPLKKLYDARQKLAALLTYMDGKAGAENLLGRVLEDQELLKTLAEEAAAEGASEGTDAADSADAKEEA
jgi:type VI secretion system protein ImpB